MSRSPPTDAEPVVLEDVEAKQPRPVPEVAQPEVGRQSDKAEEVEEEEEEDPAKAPPLPSEPLPPPLPLGAPPDDGWDPLWDENAQAFYFYNRFTQATQWENPRVPDATPAAGVANHDRIEETAPERPYGGYDPAIHGDYDPTAPYAQEPSAAPPNLDPSAPPLDPASAAASSSSNLYTTPGTFNRWTGAYQNPTTQPNLTPTHHSDDSKSKRQMNAFFDVDAAANSHNGRSLKAERSGKKLSKQELKAFKEKRKEKKEEKRRAWLRD